MTPEEKQLLENVLKLSEENNVILKSMHRSAKWQLAIKLLYWGVIIVASIGAYYGLKSYLNYLSGSISGAGTQTTPQSLIDQLKSLQGQN